MLRFRSFGKGDVEWAREKEEEKGACGARERERESVQPLELRQIRDEQQARWKCETKKGSKTAPKFDPSRHRCQKRDIGAAVMNPRWGETRGEI